MNTYIRRFAALFLCFILVFPSFVVPSSAILLPTVETVLTWLGGVDVALSVLSKLADFADGKSNDTNGLIVPISALDSPATRTQLTHDYLLQLAYDWNKTCSEDLGFTCDVLEYHHNSGNVYGVVVARIDRNIASRYLADGTGRILYCDLTEETSGRWEPEDEATLTRHLMSYVELNNLANSVGGTMRINGGFREIINRQGEVYCNVSGYRFSCIYEPDKTAINQDRETTVNNSTVTNHNTVNNSTTTQNITNDNSITNNNYDQSVNIEDMTQILPGGTQNIIDNLIYNPDTKTYYVDSHDVTNNITQNYSYQYHINYTSITYIGQTEEYVKRYELYYQLPDGRDSADLTPEELEQLNVDIDVIPYVRYADNMDIRSLYHFDGDTRDSSYWNYATSFAWNEGASLTYMESGAFNGALYLDELSHDFQLTLATESDAAADWTLQWRYYQSHTEAPVKDSSVYVGGLTVLQLDGKYLYTAAGDQIAPLPVGSWNEICIIRSQGILYYFINGVYYTSCKLEGYFSNTVRFLFGDQQQTYKYFDELRFARGNLYTPGENYTPTSVPHDSNLTLVLPSGLDVVLDEVMVLTPSEDNLLTPYNRSDWTTISLGSLELSYDPYYPVSSYQNVYTSGYPFLWDRDYIGTTKVAGQGRTVRFGGTAFTRKAIKESHYTQPHNSYSVPLFYDSNFYGQYYRSSTLVGDWQAETVYTYSVVLADGSYSSITFRIDKCWDDDRVGCNYSSEHGHYCSDSTYYLEQLKVVQNSVIRFSFEEHGLSSFGYDSDTDDTHHDVIYPVTALCWNSATDEALVRYTELVTGDTPGFEVGYETSVYTSGDLEHSPTLAVRTDVTITDHQIGGVRPSVPEKGQVWALVESGYITSLQVYNGSVWLNCDGRIWTGSRWIPASSYNVITLQDMYDIVDSTHDYEYIYTESGFWSWFQKAWNQFMSRVDEIIELLKLDTVDECQHVYDSKIDRDPGCVDPGHVIYTCSNCGHIYTSQIDPLGHDWVVTDRIDTMPDPADAVLKIIQQPQDCYVADGETFSARVYATGYGLTYAWYYRESGKGSFKLTSTFQSHTYATTMNSTRDGRQAYCIITDAYGNSVRTDTVTFRMGESPVPDLEIIRHPQDVYAYDGSSFSMLVNALGEDLKYSWYMSSVSGSFAVMDGFNSNSFSMPVSSSLHGRQVYCVVTDAHGNSVQSETATIHFCETPYDVVVCSRCGIESKDYGEGPLESDVFDALGDFVAEGITWLLDKATELVNALQGITDTFNRFVDRIRGLIGAFPLFLSAIVLLFPEDLATVIWFGVIAFVVRAVWKKYNKS